MMKLKKTVIAITSLMCIATASAYASRMATGVNVSYLPDGKTVEDILNAGTGLYIRNGSSNDKNSVQLEFGQDLQAATKLEVKVKPTTNMNQGSLKFTVYYDQGGGSANHVCNFYGNDNNNCDYSPNTNGHLVSLRLPNWKAKTAVRGVISVDGASQNKIYFDRISVLKDKGLSSEFEYELYYK